MAKLPKLAVVLLAEQLRPEINNKTSILGYCGISPFVKIHVPQVPTAINLAVLFQFEIATESGSLPMRLDVHGPSGIILAKRDAPDAFIMKENFTASFALTFQPMPIAEIGTYKINVYAPESRHEASFRVELFPKDAFMIQ